MADRSFTTTVGANGKATIPIRPDGLRPWIVSQVTVEMKTAPAGAKCSIRKNGYLVTLVIPNGDAATEDPPVTLNAGDTMTVEWESCTPNDPGSAFVIYEEAYR